MEVISVILGFSFNTFMSYKNFSHFKDAHEFYSIRDFIIFMFISSLECSSDIYYAIKTVS